jgi:signal transduction histidine kinase
MGSIVPMCLLMLLFLFTSERFHLIQLVLGIALMGLMVWAGFRGTQVWLAPTSGLLNLLLAYMLWDWHRLSIVVHYLQQQLTYMHDKLPSGAPETLKSRVYENTMDATMREIDNVQIRLNTLDQTNREMIQFLSHDLRTPQVNILSAMHLFEQNNPQWQENTEYQKLSTQIKKNAYQTINFAHDIVEFSQVRNEQMHLEEHNIGHLIHFAYEKTYIQAQSKHIQIKRQFDERYEEWAWAYVDGELIERAIINLITNAIRYSPEYSQITLGLTQNADRLVVTVTDQGEGMSDALVARLLNQSNSGFKSNDAPIKNTHTNQSTQPDAAGSMGIGWRMILTIIDKHEGIIDIKPNEHCGTKITLSLKSTKK